MILAIVAMIVSCSNSSSGSGSNSSSGSDGDELTSQEKLYEQIDNVIAKINKGHDVYYRNENQMPNETFNYNFIIEYEQNYIKKYNNYKNENKTEEELEDILNDVTGCLNRIINDWEKMKSTDKTASGFNPY